MFWIISALFCSNYFFARRRRLRGELLIFHLFFWQACDFLLLFLILHPLTPTSFFFFFFNPPLSEYRCYFGCWTALVCSFPAGHVTGLCYLKHDAALGGVGGGVSILQCYRAKNRNGSFMEEEREWCDRLHTVAVWMWTAESPFILLFNYTTLASDALFFILFFSP